MLFVTNKPPFAITVAATIYLSLIFCISAVIPFYFYTIVPPAAPSNRVMT